MQKIREERRRRRRRRRITLEMSEVNPDEQKPMVVEAAVEPAAVAEAAKDGQERGGNDGDFLVHVKHTCDNCPTPAPS